MKHPLLLIMMLLVSSVVFSSDNVLLEKPKEKLEIVKFKIPIQKLPLCVTIFRSATVTFIGCDGELYSSTLTGSGFFCDEDPTVARIAAGVLATANLNYLLSKVNYEEEGPPCN